MVEVSQRGLDFVLRILSLLQGLKLLCLVLFHLLSKHGYLDGLLRLIHNSLLVIGLSCSQLRRLDRLPRSRFFVPDFLDIGFFLFNNRNLGLEYRIANIVSLVHDFLTVLFIVEELLLLGLENQFSLLLFFLGEPLSVDCFYILSRLIEIVNEAPFCLSLGLNRIDQLSSSQRLFDSSLYSVLIAI